MSTPIPPHPHAPTPPDRPQVVRTIGAGPAGEGPDDDLQATNAALARWGLGLSLLAILIGLVWSAMLLRQSANLVDTSEWPNTLGMVLECSENVPLPNERRTHTHVKYRYDVEGRRYTSTRVAFGPVTSPPCSRYPLGKAVRVYYAPWRPSQATLTQSEGGAMPAQLGGAFFCMLVGLVLGITQVGALVRPAWARRPVE